MERFLEYVKMSLGNIRTNKGRSFLTMLGIIIGIASVVTIISIGDGLKENVVDASSQQNNTVTIQTDSDKVTATEVITDDDILYLENSLEGLVTTMSSTSLTEGMVTTGKGDFKASITYATAGYADAQYTSPVVSGSYFTEQDITGRRRVCVIDEITALYLFGNTDVIGMEIEVNIENTIEELSVLGIRETSSEEMEMEESSQDMDMDKSISLELPFSLAADFGDPIDGFSSVAITAADPDKLQQIAKMAIRILDARHQDLGENPFVQQKDMELDDLFGPIMDGITAFIALVAGISLVVGGIGVMNIMLVSVTERTREIGIRKALGARTGSIVAQFLCESAIITSLGGVIGILLGMGLTSMITAIGLNGLKAKLSFRAMAIATGFSCGIGIVFGIYPARKAAKLNPIDALRWM